MLAEAAHARLRVFLIIGGGAFVFWLLLLPVSARIVRSAVTAWIPGQGRAVRACRQALARDEIELVYQPQQNFETGRIDAVEALVRWRRGGELRPPANFLPAIETTKAMRQLTNRVLDLALAQLAAWRAEGVLARMSVNLSATDLDDDVLPARVAGKLAAHGLRGNDLTLEVTETALLGDRPAARRVLQELDRQGIDISLDDFGAGNASISRLYALPVTELKIDRQFVADPSEHAREYLAAIAGFGQRLGMRVVAEGIEDSATMAVVRELGCDLAQGYHVGRPQPAEQLFAGQRTGAAAASAAPGAQRPLATGSAVSRWAT
jgi:EAL domain-containing protein (putative c-di-GMP-specific phosphodiesterase class I)